MAREVAREENLSEDQCSFYEVDATIDPNVLLCGMYIDDAINFISCS
jgi:hypothetical protein